MIEFFALIFLCKKNGALALSKGVSVLKWKLLTILGWFVAEVIGFIFGIMLFGKSYLVNVKSIDSIDKSDLYGLMAIGLISAFGGYLLVKAALEKMPDSFEDDINKINVNDLRPPQKN